MRIFFLFIFIMSTLVSSAREKPNIVFFLIDDMGWKDLTCTGSTYYETPRIDQLAKTGALFNNAYSSSPVCAPSRGAILTGKSPARTGFTTVVNKAADSAALQEKSKFQGGENQFLEALHYHKLPKNEVLYGEALGNNGYETGFFGKWHCGIGEGYFPDDRGFDVAVGYRTTHVFTSKSGHWMKTFKKYGANLDGVDEEAYVADALTEKSIAFMAEHKDKPFALTLSHYLVHAPIQPKPDKLQKYKAKKTTDQTSASYAAMVESVDDSVGQIVDALEELGLRENTLIIFTSDNGGQSATSNYPILGQKSTPYLGGHRVPFIMSWPKVIPPTLEIEESVVGMDIYPTMLDAAGVPLMPEQHADGVSLLPLVRGASINDRALVFHFPHYTASSCPYSSILYKDWQLIRFYNDAKGAYQLFNIKDDQSQQNDLAAQQPEVLGRLITRMDKRLLEMGARMPIANPNYNPDATKKIQNLETTYQAALKRFHAQKKAAGD